MPRYFITFLFTPSFRRWATNPNTFIPNALCKIFSGSVNDNSELVINSTVAVVDGIPEPNEAIINTSSTEPKDDRPAKARSFEGVSFFLMGIGPKFRICRQHTQDLMNDDCGDAKDSLTIYTSAYRETQEMRKTGNLQKFTSAIQVPLANTSLRNGLPTTIFSYKWRLIGKENLQMVARRQLDLAKLYWPSVPQLSADERHLLLSTNLVPLTHPRVIKSSMGNIIRSVTKILPSDEETKGESMDETDENSFTASKELEQAMGTCFASGAVDPNDANVWALVIPRKVYEKDIYLWKNVNLLHSDLSQNRISQNAQESSANERFIFRLIGKGARLHRVTSGGGGWGNRAGLLSLDPEYSFGTQNEFSLAEFASSKGTFPSIASPGNIVQFFIRRNDNSITPEDDSNEKGPSLDHEAPIGKFEVLHHATEDNVESQSTSKADDSLPVIRAYDKYFGAASEKGLGLGLSQWDKDVFEISGRRIWKTKIDVPGSRILIKVNDKNGFTPEERKGRNLTKKRPNENYTFEERLDALKRYKFDSSSDMVRSGPVAIRYHKVYSAENNLDLPHDANMSFKYPHATVKRLQTIEGSYMQPSTPEGDPRDISRTWKKARIPTAENRQPSQLSKRRNRNLVFQKYFTKYELSTAKYRQMPTSYKIRKHLVKAGKKRLVHEKPYRAQGRIRRIRTGQSRSEDNSNEELKIRKQEKKKKTRSRRKLRLVDPRPKARLRYLIKEGLKAKGQPQTGEEPDLLGGVASFLKGS